MSLKKHKSKKQTRARNTIAKVIEAQPTIAQAIHAALWGKQEKGRTWRPPTEIELKLQFYYMARQTLERALHPGSAVTEKWRLLFEDDCQTSGAALNELIFTAINEFESEPLRHLANAIDEYKTRPKGRSPDLKRATILQLKKILDDEGRTMPILRLEEIIGEKGGRTALHRLCRKLEFPLTPGKPGRPKNSGQITQEKRAQCHS